MLIFEVKSIIMELRLEIGYSQLLELIKQLPAGQIAKLKSELTDKVIEESVQKQATDFSYFLLQGPVMSKENYQIFVDNRKSFQSWRGK